MKKLILVLLICILLIGTVSSFNLDDDLISYYKFDEQDITGSGTIYDELGINNATNHGASNSSGKINTCYSYTTNDYLTIEDDDSLDFGDGNFSFFIWVYPTDITGDHTYIVKGDDISPVEPFFIFRSRNTGILNYFSRNTDNSVTDSFTTTEKITLNDWNFVGFVRYGNGTTLIYVNNVIKSFGDSIIDITNTATVYIGTKYASSAFMEGKLDEGLISGRAFSPDEATQLWNDGYGLSYPFPEVEIAVTLISPSNSSVNSKSEIPFITQHNISIADFNWTNTTYYIWYENGTIFNNSVSVDISGQNNKTNETIHNFVLGKYYWNNYACYENVDSSNCIWAYNNYSLEIGSSILNHIFSNTTYETKRETFILTLELLEGSEISLAQLTYNGTNYPISNITTSGTNITLTKIIDIPLNSNSTANETKEFFYKFTYEGDSIQEIGNYEQNVSYIYLTLCDATYTIQTLNFTLTDEISQIKIDPDADTTTTFEAAFYYYLGGGSIYKNYSYTLFNSTTKADYQFCIHSLNHTFNCNMNSMYSAINYVERAYNLLNATLTNESSDIILYLLPDEEAVKFTITVKEGVSALTNSLITVAKFFIGDGIYKTTSIRLTDDDGEFIEYLDLDRDYRYSIVKDGVLLAIINKKASCDIAPCGITLQISEVQGSVWETFAETYASNILSNLSVNYSSNIITYSFIDVTGLAQYFRLEVSKLSYNESGSTICNTYSYSSSGTLTCNITGYSGDLIAKTYISRSPEKLDKILHILISAIKEKWGMMTVFFTFLWVLTLTVVGAVVSRGNPSVMVAMFGMSILTAKLMTILPFSWGIVGLIELLVLLLLSKLKT